LHRGFDACDIGRMKIEWPERFGVIEIVQYDIGESVGLAIG
jgi:hypothetical protein